MTINQLHRDVRNLLNCLSDSGLVIHVNPVCCSRSGLKTVISWRSLKGVALPISSTEFASVDEYCDYLRYSSYSAILFDGSLLQVSYEYYRRSLVKHRLCFYPCPFEVDIDLLQSEPILDVIDAYREDGEEYLRLRSPIRFDYNQDMYSKDHPTTHVHMLKPCCRCAVVAPLSLGHFVKFVFSNFYPRAWKDHEFIRQWPQWLGNRTITPDEEKSLHFACRRDAPR